MKTYYYIDEVQAAACCEGDSCWLYDRQLGWTKVHNRVVQDYLYGYDPSEPADSPYRFGNMSEIRQISEAEAERRCRDANYQYIVKEADREQ